MDEAALVLAERSVQEAPSDPDRRLEHLLHASEELQPLMADDGVEIGGMDRRLPHAENG